ncbi:BglG family transcription antiterminator LicT [Amedibacillus sp. YH-ame6]
MKILRVLNNNAVSCLDSNGEEIIAKGKGIAFQRSAGDDVDETKVEKIFTLQNKETNRRFQQILVEIPSDCIEVSEEIITMIKSKTDKTINDTIYITLTDHISNLLERIKMGIEFDNTLLWDIKRMYREEYEIGLSAVEIINERFDIKLQNDEASFVALHIVNAEMDVQIKDVYRITSLIDEVYKMVKDTFDLELDSEDLIYTRFVLHLRFFFERLMHEQSEIIQKNEDLLDIMKHKYQMQYECVENICQKAERKFSKRVSIDEKLYLLIHIVKLTTK